MEFKDMRRFNQQMSEEECKNILKECSYGVLAVIGENGYPYGVPLNYVYYDKNIYFHCATQGHKYDALMHSAKVSFTVVGEESVMPSKFATRYKSVIVFGNASVIEDDAEKTATLEALVEKYAPEYEKEGKLHIEKLLNKTAIVRIEAEHITGKFHD